MVIKIGFFSLFEQFYKYNVDSKWKDVLKNFNIAPQEWKFIVNKYFLHNAFTFLVLYCEYSKCNGNKYNFIAILCQ